MADARGRLEWEQTACLMALIVNLVRDPKKNRPVKPDAFNPYAQKGQKIAPAPLSILKEVFVKKSNLIIQGCRD